MPHYNFGPFPGHGRNDPTKTYGLVQSAAPATEPVTLEEAKLHLRVDHTDDETLIENIIIPAASRYCEAYTARQFVTGTFVLTMDAFPDVFYMPKPSLLTVTSITYLDSAGDSQPLSTDVYTVDIARVKGRIVRAFAQVWPVTQAAINAVTVTFTAGFGAAGAVPDQAKSAILMYCSDLYEHRSSGTEFTTSGRGVGQVMPNPTANAMLDTIRVIDAN